MSHLEEIHYPSMLERMDKGFMICQALYSQEEKVIDYKIVTLSDGMEKFVLGSKNDLLSKRLKADHCMPELSQPLMDLFSEVNLSGNASQTVICTGHSAKSIQAFAFQMQPHVVACYLEFCGENKPSGHRNKAMNSYEIFNAIEDALWVRKRNTVVFVNTSFERLFGVPREQIRQACDILAYVDERDFKQVLDILESDCKRHQVNYSLEFRIRRSDGMTRWVWMKTFPLEVDALSNNRKSAVFMDITSRKHAEEELLRSNREIMVLNELFKKASEHIDLNELMNSIQRLIMEHMTIEIMGIHLYDEKNQNLTFRYCPNIPDVLLKQEGFCSKVQELIKWVYETKNSFFITVSELPDDSIRQLIKDHGLQYINCFPVLYNDTCVGALVLGSRVDDLTYKEKDFIMAICSQLAVLINHSKLYDELMQELEMRHNAERQNKLIFNTSIDLIAIMDDNMKFLRIGPQWQKCLGWSEKEVLSKSFFSLIHVDDRDNTLEYIDTLTNERMAMGIEHRLMCKDGTFRWIAWNAQMVTESRKNLIIMIGRDMTRNKEMEEKNRDLERAYHMEAVKMEFFANISHEFRTPLNIILSALQLIEHSLQNKGKADYVDREIRHLKSIKQNAFRLLRLVNNLIDITKLDSGYMRLYSSNHDIVKVTRSITESVAQYIEGKGIKLMFETNVPKKIIACDADMIERILLNLLSNAVKYTEKDGFIGVCVKSTDNVVRISVKDSGVGISENMLDLIFERFIQIEKPLSRRCEGSGIGLSLAKALVELHQGRIYVNSTVNKGSEFTFELPAVIMDQGACLQNMEPSREERIHRINVEFSDIYSLNL